MLCWSSGKDSAWTLHVLRRRRDVEVVGLLTTINTEYERVAMHAVRVALLEAQAEAVGLPLWSVPIPNPCSNQEYEAAMGDAVRKALAAGITTMAFGDLFLEDVRRYRETQLAGTGLTPIFPLWGIPTPRLAREMIAGGLRARVSTLDPRVMPRDLIGAEFDEGLLARLPPGVDPCAERGEFHTCVTAGPMFSKPLEIECGEVVDREGFVYGDLTRRGIVPTRL